MSLRAIADAAEVSVMTSSTKSKIVLRQNWRRVHAAPASATPASNAAAEIVIERGEP